MPITRRGFLRGVLATIGVALVGKPAAVVEPQVGGYAAEPFVGLRKQIEEDLLLTGNAYVEVRTFPGLDMPAVQTIRLGNEDGSALVSTDSGYSWHNEEELCQY